MAEDHVESSSACNPGVAERMLPGVRLSSAERSILHDSITLSTDQFTWRAGEHRRRVLKSRLRATPVDEDVVWLTRCSRLEEATFRRVTGGCVCEAIAFAMAHALSLSGFVSFYDPRILYDVLTFISIQSSLHFLCSSIPQITCVRCRGVADLARFEVIRMVHTVDRHHLEKDEALLVAQFLILVMESLGYSVLQGESGPSTGGTYQHLGRLETLTSLFLVADDDERCLMGPAIGFRPSCNLLEEGDDLMVVVDDGWPDQTEPVAEHFPMMFKYIGKTPTTEDGIETHDIETMRVFLAQLLGPQVDTPSVDRVPDRKCSYSLNQCRLC